LDVADDDSHASIARGELDMSKAINTDRAQVVIRFKSGKLLKGYTCDFRPGKDIFSLTSDQRADDGETYKVKIADLKAIFFVKRFEGNALYREKKKFRDVDATHLRGHRIELQFKDGEVIRGTTLDYAVGKQGFFVTPVDPESNNEFVYVVTDAVRDVKFAAEVYQ
jgi:hypothetical protein